MNLNDHGHDIAKAAAILRAAQPEIDAIKAAKRSWLRVSVESHEDRDKRLRVTRKACEKVALYGLPIALPYKAQQLRSCVEHRGLRVKMEGGLAVIYRGV